MTTEFWTILEAGSALVVGTTIGAVFGIVQDSARKRNEQRQKDGTLKSGWGVMPGSGARVMFLLLFLILVQIICPLLFKDGIQWWVFGGVGVGYGIMLFRQLRERQSKLN